MQLLGSQTIRRLVLGLLIALTAAACTSAQTETTEGVPPSTPQALTQGAEPTAPERVVAVDDDPDAATRKTNDEALEPGNGDPGSVDPAEFALTAWFSSNESRAEFSVTAPAARTVRLNDVADPLAELTDEWIATWLDGPTAAEQDTGLMAPFEAHAPDPVCGGRFQWKLLEEAGATPGPLLIVTLCGRPLSPGHGHSGRVWSSFTATMAELTHIERAVLLEPGGANCFGDQRGERGLHCLAGPDHLWQDHPDNCQPDDLPTANTTIAVVNIAEDDPDGGLITHRAPGVASAEVDVLEMGTDELVPTLRCNVVADGGIWWEFITAADTTTPVWANAAYLAVKPDRPLPVLESPCAEFPGVGQGFFTAGTTEMTHDHIAGLAVSEATPFCTILEITLGQGWNADPPTSLPSTQLESGISIQPIDRSIGHYVLRFPSGDRGRYGGLEQRGLNVDATFGTQQVTFGSGDERGIAFVASSSDPDDTGGEVVILTGSRSEPSVITLDNPARVFLAISPDPLAAAPKILEIEGHVAFVVSRIEQLEDGTMVVAGWGLGFESFASAVVTDANGLAISDVTSFQVGNPTGAWSPFKLRFEDLPPGNHELTFDSCDQCDTGDTTSIELPVG